MEGITVSLGSDWSIGGSHNMLEEMRFANEGRRRPVRRHPHRPRDPGHGDDQRCPRARRGAVPGLAGGRKARRRGPCSCRPRPATRTTRSWRPRRARSRSSSSMAGCCTATRTCRARARTTACARRSTCAVGRNSCASARPVSRPPIVWSRRTLISRRSSRTRASRTRRSGSDGMGLRAHHADREVEWCSPPVKCESMHLRCSVE